MTKRTMANTACSLLAVRIEPCAVPIVAGEENVRQRSGCIEPTMILPQLMMAPNANKPPPGDQPQILGCYPAQSFAGGMFD